MLKLGVLVSGSGTTLQNLIDEIEQGTMDAEIAVVVSGRNGVYALERAAHHGIPSTVIRKKGLSDEEYSTKLAQCLQEYGVDLVVAAGFLDILPPEFIRVYENRILNVHPSLIPSFSGIGFYGLKVHEAVLKKGVKLTGATVHIVTEETDEGPIVLQKAVEVLQDDTAETLQKRVMEQAERPLLPEAIRLFASGKIHIEHGTTRIE